MVNVVYGAHARELADGQAAAIAALLSWAGTAAHHTGPDARPDRPGGIGSAPAEEDRAA